jgi:molecular chaperone GrpE
MVHNDVRNDDEFLEDERDDSEELDGEFEEKVEDTDSVIEKLVAQRDEYLDQLQRSRAEFINYRKRTDAEKLRLGELFTANTIGRFLPVIDDWDRAMAAVPENEHDDNWFKGIQMIQTKFHQLLEGAGVQEVNGVGSAFDPSIHEAVSVEPGTNGEYVVEVYQKGYKLGDTILRAAMVKTGDAPEEFNA